MRTTLTALLFLAACSGPTEEPWVDGVPADYHADWRNGAPPGFEPGAPNEEVDTGWNPLTGEPVQYDGDDTSGGVEKTSLFELHGWAVKSRLSTDSAGPHRGSLIPTDLNVTDLADWNANHNRGRCGRLDGVAGSPDNSFEPCVMPFGTKGNRTWSWKVDAVSCGNVLATTADINVLRSGMAAATALVTAGTGGAGANSWRFVETTGTPSILIKCASTQEERAMFTANAIAVGFPTGNLTFQFAAPITNADVCEDPVGAGSLGPPTGAAFNYLTNEMYTYNHAQIILSWTGYKGFRDGTCGLVAPIPGKEARFAKWIMLHELAHILGFQHQSDITGTANIMFPERSCNRMNITNPNYRVRMYDGLKDYDTPGVGALSLFDEDIACYSPL